MEITLYQIAERFIGTIEVQGKTANPQIMAMLQLDTSWPKDDSVPWCAASMNYWAWLLRLPRSKDLRARSWLLVGEVVELADARRGFDVVVLTRGSGYRPGPEVIDAPGHVGLYSGQDEKRIYLLGGNQGDKVCVAGYDKDRLLGVRRLI
jgi:uncharacterized protein (TIGR02594 family)